MSQGYCGDHDGSGFDWCRVKDPSKCPNSVQKVQKVIEKCKPNNFDGPKGIVIQDEESVIQKLLMKKMKQKLLMKKMKQKLLMKKMKQKLLMKKIIQKLLMKKMIQKLLMKKMIQKLLMKNLVIKEMYNLL